MVVSPYVISAKAEEVKIDESELIVEEEDVFESSQWFSLNPKIGQYVPSKTQGLYGDFQNLYGDETGLWGELTLEFQPITNYGILGLRGTGGFHYIEDQASRFENIPLHAGLIYHFKYFRHQPFVPFIEGGVSYYFMTQRGQNDYTREREGVYGSAGIQVNLNAVEPKVADRFDLNYGVNNTYLTIEYRVIRTPNAGIMNLDGEFLMAGLMMEF
ncbi:MAG: hypothetical protein HYS98_00620 [Deltaproteobacteria bacterium]|nr:hypothetical protein [Deltaproteobacteria bacterium]